MRRALLAALTACAILITATAFATGDQFPATIPLPNGFAPEGIAIDHSGQFYVGSIPTGAVYRGDVRTGQGDVLIPPETGRAAIGVDVDNHGRIFVAGGPTGNAYVYDASTRKLIASYALAHGQTFVNDVVVTRGGAYFTDSFRPVLYRIPLGPNGALGTSAQEIPLSGDIVYGAGFNANGIDATPNGKTLVIVQTNTGLLFRVDPATGVTRTIDLGGETLTAGDGILLDGKTLYVVRNVQNRIAVVRLGHDLAAGTVVTYLTSPSLDVPTTIDDFGNRLYVVNARFGTPVTPTTPYWITQLVKPHGA